MTSYEEVVEKDIELLWSIQEYVRKTPWIDNTMTKIVSKHPLQDICALIWLFCLFGLFEVGSPHFWVVAVNLAGSFVLRKLIASKRPVEYDLRLQPITDKNAESFGFPSLECHMSIVVLGDLYFRSKSLLLLVIAIPTIAIIGFSRVYSRSRFPHQVVGSWLTGAAGLYLGTHCCHHMGFHTMNHHEHGTCVALVVTCLLGYFALTIENNDSRLMYVPKKEFIRVMRGIVFPEREREGGGDRDWEGSQPPGSPAAKITSPRSAAIQRAMQDGGALGGGQSKSRQLKKDSFFFLQRTLQRREEQILHYRKHQHSRDSRALSAMFASQATDLLSSSDSEYLTGGQAT